MNSLVYLEHAAGEIKKASLSALAFAQSLSQATGGGAQFLLLGNEVHEIASQAANYAPVLVVQSPNFEHPIAERLAPVIAGAVQSQAADMLVAAATSQAKDIIGRAAGLLGGAMASDVIAHSLVKTALVENELRLDRPIFAGAAVATVVIEGTPQIVTVQASSYAAATPCGSPCEVSTIPTGTAEIPQRVQVVNVESKPSLRPDVTEASAVVSGGRALKNSDDFERLVGGLADALEGGAGSSRALVDAGITPNELQVGQTGKIIAPDLYVALGISGAVQHLAGMKNSKTVVAINKDPDAPIFAEADYGMVGDIYEIVPDLIQRIREERAIHGQ
jgi:electron transfer flavoprotein alpha subunit